MAEQPYKFRKSVERLIANFRGIPENYPGEASKSERPLANVLERVLKKYKIEKLPIRFKNLNSEIE